MSALAREHDSAAGEHDGEGTTQAGMPRWTGGGNRRETREGRTGQIHRREFRRAKITEQARLRERSEGPRFFEDGRRGTDVMDEGPMTAEKNVTLAFF